LRARRFGRFFRSDVVSWCGVAAPDFDRRDGSDGTRARDLGRDSQGVLSLYERIASDATEPAKVRDWRPNDPLFGLDNVVLTPHVAYYSEESIGTVRPFAAEEVARVLTGQPPLSSVNADELAEARWSRSP
jgi:hypothetical protein